MVNIIKYENDVKPTQAFKVNGILHKFADIKLFLVLKYLKTSERSFHSTL